MLSDGFALIAIVLMGVGMTLVVWSFLGLDEYKLPPINRNEVKLRRIEMASKFALVLAVLAVLFVVLTFITRSDTPCDDQRIQINDVWYVPENCDEAANAD